MAKVAVVKTLKRIESALATLGAELAEKGGGPDKVKAYSQLISSYRKLLETRERSQAKVLQ